MKKILLLLNIVLFVGFANGQSFSEKEIFTMCDLCIPELIEIADINGDGFDDIIIYAAYNNEVVWFDNIETTDFTAFRTLPFILGSREIIDMIFEDLDGDADVDAVLATNDALYFFYNLGNLSFSFPFIKENYVNIKGIDLLDLNHDDNLDLIINGALGTDPSIAMTIILNNEGEFGNFSFNQSYNCNSPNVYTVDMDNDGDRDIVSSCSDFSSGGFIVINENINDGEIGNELLNIAVGSISLFEVFDLNGDGNMDILFDDFGDNIMWIENLGENNFGSIDTIFSNGDYNILGTRFLDVNSDGFGDLICSVVDESILNNGIDNSLVEIVDIPESPTWDDIVYNDIDNDGFLDIYGISDSYNGLFSVLTSSNQNLDFNSLHKSQFGNAAAFSGDLNGDGYLDLIFSARESDDVNEIFWFSNDGNGSFSFEEILLSSTVDFFQTVVLDIGDDGDIDIINSALDDSMVRILINEGNNSFSIVEIPTEFEGFRDILLVDFEGLLIGLNSEESAEDDLVVMDFSNLSSPTMLYFDVSINTLRDIAFVEIDEAEVVVACEQTDSNFILTHYGDGNLPEVTVIDPNLRSANIFAVDVDGDGLMDFLDITEDDLMEIIINNGDGTFSFVATSVDIGFNSFVAAGDFDNDGDMDILDGSNINASTYIIRNNGNLDFERTLLFEDQFISTLLPIDVENDGDLDLILTNSTLNEISLIKNQLITSTQNNQNPQTNIKVLPNPTHGNITLSIDQDMFHGVIQIFDVSGRLINSYVYHPETTIDLRAYNSGIYFARIVDQKSGVTYVSPKIIKID